MLEKYLEDIGLSEKEAQVYLTLLAHDHSSVMTISKNTAMKRPTVYVILESLLKKGLVSTVEIGKKTNYRAEPPERLETFIKTERLAFDERASRLAEYIPALRAIQKESGEKPVVKYFEGKEGILQMYQEFYDRTKHEKGGQMDIIFPLEPTRDLFTPEDRKKFYAERVNRKIYNRCLYTSTYEKLEDNELLSVKKVKESLPVTADISVYKDQVEITIFGDNPSGIFIKCKDFADTMRTLFELSWEKETGSEK